MAQNTRFAVAVHILVGLAVKRGELVSSELISRSVDTNPAFIRRNLSALHKAGMVESVAGAHGGVRLAMDPDEISLLDVYEVVEEKGLFQMHNPNPICPIGQVIREELEEAFDEAEASMKETLDRLTVGEVMRKAKDALPASR